MTGASPASFLLKRKMILLNAAPVELSTAAVVKVIVEGDSDTSVQPLLERVRSIHGELKPKQLYLLPAIDTDSPRCVAVLGQDVAKRLGSHPVGSGHRATAWGAQLSALFLASPSLT